MRLVRINYINGFSLFARDVKGDSLIKISGANFVSLRAVLLGAFLSISWSVFGQGTLQITFDGPPVIPYNASHLVSSYFESGMLVSPLKGSDSFGRVGAASGSVYPRSGLPDDGSAYLATPLGASLMFSSTGGSPFGLVSVDLAEYSTVFANQPVTVSFVGYYSDGGTVTTSFTTDGIIDGTGPLADFQTFNFNSKDWSGLTRVEIPSYGWSLDNLVVTVPEPGVFSLFGLGTFAMIARRFYRRNQYR